MYETIALTCLARQCRLPTGKDDRVPRMWGVMSGRDEEMGTPSPRHHSGRVFVSSTSIDLTRYRERVRDVLLRLELFPAEMEVWGAQGAGTATTLSLDKLASCDCYLLLVAWRYGTVRAGETRSVTEQEYDGAVRLGLPRYVFLADPATEADDALFPAAQRNPDQLDQLRAFRARLEAENLREYFTTPEDLAMRTATALAGYVARLQAEREPGKHSRPVDGTRERAVTALFREAIQQSKQHGMQKSQERLIYVLANWREMSFDAIPQTLDVTAMEDEAAATAAGPISALIAMQRMLGLLLTLLGVASISVAIVDYERYLQTGQASFNFFTLWMTGFEGSDPLTISMSLTLAALLVALILLLSCAAFALRVRARLFAHRYRAAIQRILLEMGKLKSS